METIDFSDFKVRCSAISQALSNSRSNPTLTEKQLLKLKELEAKETLTDRQKEELAELLVKKDNGSKIVLSDTCIAYLMEEYAWRTERMVSVTKQIMDVPQMQKGVIVESDSLTLLSMVDGILYTPNVNEDGERERVSNEFLSGEVDAYVGESIMTANIIPDIKSIWDFPTFLCKIHEPLTTANDWQLKGYADITGSEYAFVANCLIDTPESIIEATKYKLLNKLGNNVATEESPVFKAKWSIVERSMRFNHIPHHKRVFKKQVTLMTPEQQTLLYDRVKVCRDWLNYFHEEYSKINL